MLARLSIRDIVLIDRLDIEFADGLTILTGETGAGKSILLDALSLALGARGDGALTRHGEAQGQVTASFDMKGGVPAKVPVAVTPIWSWTTTNKEPTQVVHAIPRFRSPRASLRRRRRRRRR